MTLYLKLELQDTKIITNTCFLEKSPVYLQPIHLIMKQTLLTSVVLAVIVVVVVVVVVACPMLHRMDAVPIV